MTDKRRWPRVSQRDKKCEVRGCLDECVSNDMCARHNMAMHRYGSPLGKKPVKKVCKNRRCRKRFSHKLEKTEYCSPECYKGTDEYKEKRRQAVKRRKEKK